MVVWMSPDKGLIEVDEHRIKDALTRGYRLASLDTVNAKTLAVTNKL